MGKIKVLFFVSLATFFVFCSSFLYYQASLERQHPGGTEAIDFTIAPGEELAAIAKRLKEANLINSTTLFRLYAKSSGLSPKLQAGRYHLPQNLSLIELVELLQHGTFDIKLTFIEGWRREEMAEYLKSKISAKGGSASGGKNRKSKIAEEFLELTKDLEGYLFPDTYIVPAEISAKDLVALMKENFHRRVEEKMVEEAREQGLDLSEVVTLASIVEREAKFSQDRPLVAGILLKRYRSGWPLGVDATVQYAKASAKLKAQSSKFEVLDFWPKEITGEDLEVDSPYNTRKYTGLPPTPICNPGLETIKAVIYPEESPYWYYLSDAEGRMHYAATLEEHDQNAAQYL